MDVVVVIDVVDGLEEPLDLPNGAAVHGHEEHHPRRGALPLTEGDVLHPPARIAPPGAAVPDVLVVEFSRLVGARDVADKFFAFRRLCPRKC